MNRTLNIFVLTAILNVVFSISGLAQCVQSVDFNTWEATGDSTVCVNPPWQIQNNGTTLLSGCNTNYPTLFVGPDTLINVRVTGTFRVEDNADDDYIGFVFGFQETWDYAWTGGTMLHDYYLFDWKKNTQNYIGYVAQEGFSLVDVDGTWTRNIPSVFPSFWVHTNSVTFDVLQTDFSATNGWVQFTNYDFELLYTPTRAVILIDSDTIFDESGCFEPGLFGFYNYSQQSARYLNFNYELFVDYQIESQDVCLGDTARFNFLDTSGCATANAFSNLQSFYWEMGDGTILNDTNPRHVYATADTFIVSLIATDINGCTDTSTKEVYIHPPPTAQVFADDACLGDSMNLIDTSLVPMGEITSWDWDFGDGSGTDTLENPWYTYQTAGTFGAQLIIETNAGCIDTVVHDVNVLPGPTIDFDFQNVCFGDTASFFHSVTPATAGIVDYYWDVQNDSIQDYSGDSIVHVYPSHGAYGVELRAVDSAGCRDSLAKTILIHPLPDVDFVGPGTCFNEESEFIDSTSIPTGSLNFWEWDYDDGQSTSYGTGGAPSPGPSHLYGAPGPRNVTLTVTSDSGCVDSFSKQVQVYFLPIADFDNDTVCDDRATNFVNTSINQSGFLNQWKWEFGDGDSAFSADILHNYDQPGYYKVTYTVTSNYGCMDTVQKGVRTYPVPLTAFGWKNNVCEGEQLPFTDQSTIAQVTPGGDQITAWRWIFNGTDTIQSQNPLYPTTSAEDIFVSLRTTSNYGCSSNAQNLASIFALPIPDFLAEPACAGDTTRFLNYSSVPGGLIQSSLWRFDIYGSSTEENPGVIFGESGNQNVTLTVTSNKGCVDTITKKIEIPATPTAIFDIQPKQGCSPLAITAVNQSSIEEGGLTYQWFIDDSLVSEDADPLIVVHNDTIIPIQRSISLIAYSTEGCPNEYRLDNGVALLPAPLAGFETARQTNDPFDPVIDFQNTSKYGVRWKWHFGDGSSSDDFQPSHFYNASGEYKVRQTVWNEYNCPDSLIELIDIEPVTTLYVPKAFTPNGDGVNDTWFVKGFNEGKEFSLMIFNRWGNLMFESERMDFEWDGKMPNSDKWAPIGSYAYSITYMTSDNREETVTGTFTMIR